MWNSLKVASVVVLFGCPARAQEAGQPAPIPAWRSEVIGFEGEVPITLGEMVAALEELFLPQASQYFDSEYGTTLRGSEQVQNWIQAYLDLRALRHGASAESIRAARERAIADAHELIARRVEERLAAAAKPGASAPFPPGVTSEAWAEHELRRYLTNDGFALLDRVLAEEQVAPVPYADVLRHYAGHLLRWDGGLDVSMLFLSFRDGAKGTRLDVAAREEVRKRAEALHAELLGGADFADLARRRSEDASTAAKGGRIGWLSYAESPLPEDATSELFDTPAGNISAPVRTRRGFFIFFVHERRTRPSPPFAKIERVVSEDLRRERARRHVQKLRELHRIDES